VQRPDSPLVLIVDDSPANLKLARDVLGLAGLRTLEASTVGEAFALASRHLPDVILMDLHLPDGDGSQAARRLHADPRTAPVPIVAMSAMRLGPGDDWLFDAGFAGYISKPIDTATFPDEVRRFLRPA
jgi:two-component system cell cycle response regulator DivK